MLLKGYARQFIKSIGYVPFPGTLNARLEKREFVESSQQFDTLGGIMIDGSHDGMRAYGWVKCFPGTANGTMPCHLIRLERTHHKPSIVEIITGENIREAAGLKDGSRIAIAVQVSR